MAVTMLDIHIKHILEFGLKTIRANPDKHLKDIFGDFTLDPHAALYGGRMIGLVKNWITKTEIPVILGFDLSAAKMPAITIHLMSTTPSQTFIGDYGGTLGDGLEAHQKEVIVPKFKPKVIEWNADNSAIIMTLPDEMPIEQKELFIPGLKVRDAKGREYAISSDDNGRILLIEDTDAAPLSQISIEELEVVSPIFTARYSRGHMLMDEVATVAVHGHSDRNEGLWLYYIAMWILLKYRPLMTQTFGLDLAIPSASDFTKDDSTIGTNTWRRFINISAKSLWTWESARQKDVVAILSSIFATSAGPNNNQ